MLLFPNCKINLGLHIVRKRDDGFHDLETVFYPLSLRDALEAVTAEEPQFTTTGLPVQGPAADNLCLKAYHLLKKDYPQLPVVAMHLHKTIPMGAGLGGGSSDGSFTLRLLNDKYHLELSQEQLIAYALQLGSDCPFFIINKPCIASGRGEQLTPIELDLSGYSFLLVNPGIHINTGWAFSQITPAPSKSVEAIIGQPIANWRDQLQNDFEIPVCKHHPQLAGIKDKLYDAGALYASMSGSGSCFYGIFPKGQLPETITLPNLIRCF